MNVIKIGVGYGFGGRWATRVLAVAVNDITYIARYYGPDFIDFKLYDPDEYKEHAYGHQNFEWGVARAIWAIPGKLKYKAADKRAIVESVLKQAHLLVDPLQKSPDMWSGDKRLTGMPVRVISRYRSEAEDAAIRVPITADNEWERIVQMRTPVYHKWLAKNGIQP